MPVLTFDVGGPNEMDVPCTHIGHAPPRNVGDKGYSASGAEWSQIRGQLMVVPFVTAPLPWAQIRTIRTMFALAKRVNCAGDGFNKPGTIVCSADLTDELDETGDRGVISGTLFEIGAFTTTPATPPAAYLTNVTSPDDPGSGLINVATADPAGDSNGFAGLDLLALATPATCGSFPNPAVNCAITYTDPETPEKIWLTAATVANGWLTGRPSIVMQSSGGTYDRWQAQESRADIIVVRGGVDVATWPLGYSANNGGFASSAITMTGTVGIAFYSLIGDRFRIELFGRLGLHGGYTDDGKRQRVGWGYVGGGIHWARLYIAGLATVLLP